MRFTILEEIKSTLPKSLFYNYYSQIKPNEMLVLRKGSYSKFSWEGFQSFPPWIRRRQYLGFVVRNLERCIVRSNVLCCLIKVTGKSNTFCLFRTKQKMVFWKFLPGVGEISLIISGHASRCWKPQQSFCDSHLIYHISVLL